MYSVEDPHLAFINSCRQRDRSKEIHGPIRMKLISSYDRIKTDLDFRGALPKHKQTEAWDVVPIIRRSSQTSMHTSPLRNSSDQQVLQTTNFIDNDVMYVPRKPKVELMNIPAPNVKEKTQFKI